MRQWLNGWSGPGNNAGTTGVSPPSGAPGAGVPGRVVRANISHTRNHVILKSFWFKKSWLLSSNQTRTDLVPGVAPTRGIDDKQSTLSRYWTMDRSLQRKLGKTNYQHIKRLCRDRGQLFEDTDFPPSNKAIYSHRKPALHPIVWMRPHVSQF